MTIDEELLSELRALVSKNRHLRELSAPEAHDAVEEVRRHFVIQADAVWWWQALKSASQTLAYGDADGLQLISKLVPSAEVVRLVVTDDEHGPWPVFEGQACAFLEILREVRFFEYFLASRNGDWVVFDTHHNALVATGTILQQARSFA